MSYSLHCQLECSVQIRIPHALLGYMWASDQVDEHQDQASFLRVLIALEPPISSKDDPSALVTMLLFFFNFHCLYLCLWSCLCGC